MSKYRMKSGFIPDELFLSDPTDEMVEAVEKITAVERVKFMEELDIPVPLALRDAAEAEKNPPK